MKQFNQWLLAVLVMCVSLGSYAQQQPTCALAALNQVTETNSDIVSLATSADTAWYSFTAPANGYLTITSCDKSNPLTDTRLFFFEGTCGALTTIGTSDNDCGLAALLNDVPVEGGKTYFIRWDNKNTGLLTFPWQSSFRAVGIYTNPLNDNICSATTIVMNGGASGNNEDATVQGSAEQNLSIPVVTDASKRGWILDANIHNSIWYKFVAPSTGVVNIYTDNSTFDAQLAVFSGACTNIAGLTLMSAADDLPSNVNPALTSYCVTPGQTYFIMVDGFGTESGTFDIYVDSVDLNKPFIVLTTTTELPVNGALCPGEENWDLSAQLVSQSDSLALADANYVNALKYSWKNGSNVVVSTTSSLNSVDADTYTVTVTDTCGTVFTSTVVLTDTVINPLDLVFVSSTNPTCIGDPSGTVTFTHSGGYRFTDNSFDATDSLQFTYKQNLSTTATNAQIFGSATVGVANLSAFTQLSQGSYRIYLEDACGTVDSITFVLTDPSFTPIQLDSVSAVNPICPLSATGSINLFAAGGEGLPLTYAWSRSTDGGVSYTGTLYTTQDIIDVTAGLYRVIVSDPCNTQIDTLFFTLVDPTVAALDFTAVEVDPTSFSAKNGSINITVTGGLPNYNATWTVDGASAPELDNMLSLTNRAQGIYNVYITDTCSSAGFIDTTFVLLAPIANDIACSAIVITANDSLTTYHNIGANATETLIIPLNQDEGYDGWSDVNINRSVWFKFVAPSSAVSLTATHYQGLVSNLNFDPQIAVYDASNCASQSSFDLVGANDNNFNGGPINDSYLELFCLTPGKTYYVLVDGYQGVGEQGIFTLDLEAISVSNIAVETSTTQPNCIQEFGSITVDNVSGGVYATDPELYLYKYTFTGGFSGTIEVDGFGDPVTPLSFNNLTAGNYTLTVSDTCGNTSVKNFTIAPIAFTPFVLDYTLEQPNCPGDGGGYINFTISGGGTPDQYSYEITKNGNTVVSLTSYDANFPPNEYLDGAGIYSIQVFDGCGNPNTKEFVVELTDKVLTPFSAVKTTVSPTCPGGSDGSITITLTGGSYQADSYFRLNGGYIGYFYVDSSSTFTNASSNTGLLPAGDYRVEIYDYCGGDTTMFFTILDPTASPVLISNTIANPTTNGGSNGSFTYSITGGYPAYTVYAYELNMIGGIPVDTIVTNFTANAATSYTVNGLSAGFYRLAVNDACGDIITTDEQIDFELVNPPLNNNVCDAETLTLGVAATGTNVAATVQAGETSITPPLNEDCDSFLGWCANNGIDASVWYTFTVPASGTFNVNVTSADFDPQVAVYTTDNCTNFSTFTLIAANDDSATSPLNQDAYVEAGCLSPGSTVYVLVDASDSAFGSFTIVANEISTGALDILANVTNSSTEISNDGSIDVLAVGGVKPYTYSWSDGFLTEDRSNLGAGTYTLTVTDKCGTSVTKSYLISFAGISNDDVCNAKLLPVDGVTYPANNLGASIQAGEAGIAPDGNSQDCFSNINWCKNDGIDGTVWFKFIAPSSTVTVDLCNGAQNVIDPQIAVYSAALCSNFGTFTMLGANDDSPTCSFGSVLTLTGLTPCDTYYIMVDSDEGEQGAFGISVRDENTTLDAGNDTTVKVCQGDGTVDLNNFTTVGADAGGAFIDNDNTQALAGSMLNTNALDAGTYTFTYQVADSCGSQLAGADYATITVIVDDCSGINEVIAGNYFSIFPNPNNGVFTIENVIADRMTIEVYDITGKVVYNRNVDVTAGDKTTVNLNAPAKGVYTIRINGNVNGSEFHRIVVQ